MKNRVNPHFWFIATVSRIVPRHCRADWKQEWEAELRHRQSLLARGPHPEAARRHLLRRSLASFWDALAMQRRRTNGAVPERRAVLSSLLALTVWMPAVIIASAPIVGLFEHFFSPEALTREIVVRILVSAGFFLILRRQGWASTVGFNRPAGWRQTWLIWLPAMLVLFNLSNLIGRQFIVDPDAGKMAAWIVRGVVIAVSEETVFRGLLLAAVLNCFHSTRAQVAGSILIVSALFGIIHPATSLHWEANLAQWVTAAFASVGFCGVLLRTRSIWLLMAVHTLIIHANVMVASLTVAGPVENDVARLNAILSMLASAPLLFYGLYLIRDINQLNLAFSRKDTSTSQGSFPEASPKGQ